MKRVRFAIALLLLLVAGFILWRTTTSPPEPVYQGKTLTTWLEIYTTPTGNDFLSSTPGPIDAIRHIGTNAIPTLLRLLRAHDSSLKVKFMDLAQRQHVIKINYTPAILLNYRGSVGFQLLGANAQSAAPDILKIARENISHDSQVSAIYALVAMGPAAKPAVPYLLQWATNSDSALSTAAATALRRIDPEAAGKTW